VKHQSTFKMHPYYQAFFYKTEKRSGFGSIHQYANLNPLISRGQAIEWVNNKLSEALQQGYMTSNKVRKASKQISEVKTYSFKVLFILEGTEHVIRSSESGASKVGQQAEYKFYNQPGTVSKKSNL
jgi:hypothetical protein